MVNYCHNRQIRKLLYFGIVFEETEDNEDEEETKSSEVGSELK